MSKTWFITGTSKGFGRIWAEAALGRGDRVAATARNADTLGDLKEKYGDAVLTMALDVTDKAAVEATVTRAHEAFGRLDVLVNNAGYGQFGAMEEVSEREVRDQMETNLFGALWVTQAGAADHARAGERAYPPGLVHRRRQRVPLHRHVPRQQVGAGGLQPVAGPGGAPARHQSDTHRADRLHDRLERAVRQCSRRSCPPMTARGKPWRPGALRASRATRRRPGRSC